MPKVFEVGKRYGSYDSGIDPVLITRRSRCFVWVTNGRSTWRMKIYLDNQGNEQVSDCTVPRKWRFMGTYNAKFLEEAGA